MRYTTTRPIKKLATNSKKEMKVMIKGSREVKIQNHLDILDVSTEGCFIKYIETGEMFYSSGWFIRKIIRLLIKYILML